MIAAHPELVLQRKRSLCHKFCSHSFAILAEVFNSALRWEPNLRSNRCWIKVHIFRDLFSGVSIRFARQIALFSIVHTVAPTCSWMSTWCARSSCLRSSPHFTIAASNFQLARCPYGDASLIRLTFWCHGSFMAAAEGSSGSRCKMLRNNSGWR